MAKCPSCGAEVKAGAKFCPKLGGKISVGDTVLPSFGYEIKNKPTYSLLKVHLHLGGFVTAKAGAITYKNSNIEVHTCRSRARSASRRQS